MKKKGAPYAITIGDAGFRYAQTKYHILLHLKSVSISQLEATIDKIWSALLAHAIDSIEIYSLSAPSFFVQKPQHISYQLKSTLAFRVDKELFVEDAEQLHTMLYEEKVRTFMHKAVIESFIAEQAARFISMHYATQNADRIAHDLSLAYNKILEKNN